MGLEIKNYLTYFKADYYFGGVDKLENDEHREIFIKSCKYLINIYGIFLGKKVFLKNELLEINLNKNIQYDEKNKIYILNKKYFLENMEFILEKLYFSKKCESIIYSESLCFNIYCDPLDIKIVFDSNKEIKNNFETDSNKRSFLKRVFKFLNIKC